MAATRRDVRITPGRLNRSTQHRQVSKGRMTTATEAFDVIILGAGAAGLMCALTAGQRGRKVLLLDHADRVGAKILISGGGRCNFTNLHSAPDRFLSGNPDFCKSALGRYTQADFISLVERHCIPYHEKTLGQLFCNDSARAMSPCYWLNVRTEVSTLGSATPLRIFLVPTAFAWTPATAASLPRHLCWQRAAFRFRKWGRPVSPMTLRIASA